MLMLHRTQRGVQYNRQGCLKIKQENYKCGPLHTDISALFYI